MSAASASAAARRSCETCGAMGDKKCGRCSSAYYCSVDCQREGWASHKERCKRWLKDDGAAATRARLIEQERASGLGQLQANLVAERTAIWSAASRGEFVVIERSTGARYAPADASRRLPNGASCRIEWGAGGRGDGRPIAITFLSAPSLAAELFAIGRGDVDDFRHLDGGWLYLIGSLDLFWSAMSHFSRTGGEALLPPADAPGRSWRADTWFGTELDRTSHIVALARSRGAPAAPGGSQSLAATLVGANSRALFDITAGAFEIPTTREELPAWWRAAEALWGGAARRAREAGRPQCMFYCTPRGCARGSACAAAHEPEWRDAIERAKRASSRGGILGVDMAREPGT